MHAGYRRNSDQCSFCCLQSRQRVFRTINRAPEIDIHQLPQYIELHVVEQCAHRDPRVADQYVDPAESGKGLIDQSFAILFACHVGRFESRFDTASEELGRDLGEFGAVACTHYDFCTPVGKSIDQRFADARRRSRNNDYFSGEIHRYMCLIPIICIVCLRSGFDLLLRFRFLFCAFVSVPASALLFLFKFEAIRIYAVGPIVSNGRTPRTVPGCTYRTIVWHRRV